MKNLFKNDEFQLDEIIFSNRNKAYGAYVLRSESDRVMAKAMFIGLSLFAAIAVTPIVINAFKTADTTTIDEVTGVKIDIIDVDQPDEPFKPDNTIQQQPVERTVVVTTPTPTRNTNRETPATSVSDINDSRIGDMNIDGAAPTTSYVPIQPSITVPPPVVQPPVSPPVKNDDPVTKADVDAKFNGGINAFRDKVMNNFDTSDFVDYGDVISTTVTFIVERDGTISNISAKGKNAAFNKEAERVIKSVKGTWTPAKLGKESVRSYFKFPISMQFE